MGVGPEAAAEALIALGVDAIGGNCGNGPDELLPVIERMRAVAPDVPLVAKPNIGIPVFVGARAEYRTPPEAMAGEARALRAAGATVIGACCGSTAAHLEAMAAALDVDSATNP
jgi:methionine synthase I (cobalamin-dependent)